MILVSITSQIPQIPDRDQVDFTVADRRMDRLDFPCIIRTGKIFTIEKAKIIKTLGRVSPGTLQNAIQRLVDVFSGT